MAETVFMSAARTGTIGFLMLAGAILIGREAAPAGGYLMARLRRWLPLLLLAQLLYWPLSLLLGAETLSGLTWTAALAPAWYHIWFFYALGIVYIAVVPLRAYAAWADRQGGARRSAMLWSPVALLLAGLAWITWLGGTWGDLRPINLLIYCGYAWTGHVLATAFPRGTSNAGRLMLIGVAAAALVTAVATEAAGAPVAAYFHRCSLFVAVAAIGQFLLLMRLGTRPIAPATAARLHAVARLTLGVFLIHPLLLAAGIWTPSWALVGSLEWLSLPIAAALLFATSAAIIHAIVRLARTMRAPAETRLREA